MKDTDNTLLHRIHNILLHQIAKEEQKWVDEALTAHEAEYEREAPEFEALLEAELRQLEEDSTDSTEIHEFEGFGEDVELSPAQIEKILEGEDAI